MRPILVIKHGALGDLVQAFGPFAAIRAHHAGASITLLTTPPFASLMRQAPWFDRVEIDHRPAWWNLAGWRALARRLAAAGYARVYDLQTSDRSSRIFLAMRLAGARPEWSGIAAAASHPHANPERGRMHTVERQREQLEIAGVTEFPAPDLAWIRGDSARFGLPARTALLVPGAAPHRPGKRWPADGYGTLAARLAARGLAPVILGTAAEAPLATTIRSLCPQAIDLTGRTALADIAALAADAMLAVGNDTGPMHLIAAMGTPALVLFGPDSDPARCAPRGPRDNVRVLRAADLRDLPEESVAAALPAP